MTEKLARLPDKSRILNFIKRYKFVAIVMLVGIVLLLLPKSKEPEETAAEPYREESFSVEEMEEKLASILSDIDGAGQVKVLLTVESGMKYVYAQDGTYEQEETGTAKKTETAVISVGSGVQNAILVQQVYPQYQGALIVAEGGGDPTVRLKLTEAVSALTGLGADKISICKGK